MAEREAEAAVATRNAVNELSMLAQTAGQSPSGTHPPAQGHDHELYDLLTERPLPSSAAAAIAAAYAVAAGATMYSDDADVSVSYPGANVAQTDGTAAVVPRKTVPHRRPGGEQVTLSPAAETAMQNARRLERDASKVMSAAMQEVGAVHRDLDAARRELLAERAARQSAEQRFRKAESKDGRGAAAAAQAEAGRVRKALSIEMQARQAAENRVRVLARRVQAAGGQASTPRSAWPAAPTHQAPSLAPASAATRIGTTRGAQTARELRRHAPARKPARPSTVL